MFTLSGLILEARENLFRDFWSLFSISFYFSSEQKNATDYGLYSARTPPGRGLYKPGQASPKAQPPRNPSRAQPQPRRRRRSAGAARRPRFAAPRNPCRLKKNSVRRFSFVGFFRGYFLIAISDPIFVLV